MTDFSVIIRYFVVEKHNHSGNYLFLIMQIEIKPVASGKDLKKFIRFPLQLYKDNEYYVPPLHSEEKKTLMLKGNPDASHIDAQYWLAYKNSKLVGRIAGIVHHRFNDYHQCRSGRFGWFELIDDQQVADALLSKAERWCKDKGMEEIVGPMGFNNFNRHGVLIDGFEEVATAYTNYNYPYYQKLIENAGYKTKIDWVESYIKVPDSIPEKMKRVGEYTMKRYGLKFLTINKSSDLHKYKYQIFHVLNEAYSGLYGFLPLTNKQIDTIASEFLPILKPKYQSIVVDQDDQIVALGISVPSFSRALQKSKGRMYPFGIFYFWKAMNKPNNIDMLLVAVKPEYQNKGANALLFLDLIPIFQKDNIEHVEPIQNQKDNQKVQAQWDYFDRRIHRTTRAYYKDI